MTIIHFNTIPTPLKEVSSDEDKLIKEGLIFYSTLENSPHIDSRKKVHDFSADKIYQLVENTNKHFNMSEVGIPVLTEHKKDVNNVVGFIESPVEARVIDEVYTKGNPKLKHLLGRVGVFVKDVVIRTPEIIDRMKRGLAKTVSAGIDLDSFSIKELSLVALPAIPNATLFSYHGSKNKPNPLKDRGSANMKKVKNKNLLVTKGESNYALSLEEALNSSQSIEEQREEAMKVFTAFLEVIESANEIDEEEMASMGIQDPSEVIQGAIDDLSARLGDMFLGGMPEEQAPPAQPPARPAPNRGRFNSPSEIAMFYTGQGYTAEFGYRQAITGAFKQLRNRNMTGKSVGQIGSQFASKVGNATRGKFKSIGNAIGRVKNTFTGGVAANTTPGIPTGLRYRKNQLAKQQSQVEKYGKKKTLIGPKLPPGYKAP